MTCRGDNNSYVDVATRWLSGYAFFHHNFCHLKLCHLSLTYELVELTAGKGKDSLPVEDSELVVCIVCCWLYVDYSIIGIYFDHLQ